MNAEQITINVIKSLTGREVDVTHDVSDYFDSLSRVEFAISLGDAISDDTLFESHEFFTAKTIADVVSVVAEKIGGYHG